jgi:hypothetical protein
MIKRAGCPRRGFRFPPITSPLYASALVHNCKTDSGFRRSRSLATDYAALSMGGSQPVPVRRSAARFAISAFFECRDVFGGVLSFASVTASRTAALLRQSKLPVILMISHNLDGGVRKHVDSLSERYQNTARILLLEATDRGAALSIRSLPNHPVLTLPSDRLADLVAVLRSMNVSGYKFIISSRCTWTSAT